MTVWQWVTALSGLLFASVVLGVVASLLADHWSRFSRRTRVGLLSAGTLCGVIALVGLSVDEEDDSVPPASSTRPSGLTAGSTGGSARCLSEYFAGIAPDRVATVEEGADRVTVVRADQTKTEPFGLVLTDGNVPVGALRAQYFANGGLFKIESIVDATCVEVSRYANPARPGSDKRVVPNHEGVRVEIVDGQFYDVLLGSTAVISVRFFAFVP